MHVRLARIVQTGKTACLFRKRCSSKAFPFLVPATPSAGWGYVWVQLQRPRRLTFPPRFLLAETTQMLTAPLVSRWRWDILRCIHDRTPTLSPDAERHEAQGRHWQEDSARQQDSALSDIAAAVSRSGTLCVEWHRRPVPQDRHAPFSVPSTTCLGHQHVQPLCLPMAFCLCRDAR